MEECSAASCAAQYVSLRDAYGACDDWGAVGSAVAAAVEFEVQGAVRT